MPESRASRLRATACNTRPVPSGPRARAGVGLFYAVTVMLAAAALWLVNPQWPALLALAPAAAHLAWQVVQLRDHDAARALALFRSNRLTGSLLFAACAVVGWA